MKTLILLLYFSVLGSPDYTVREEGERYLSSLWWTVDDYRLAKHYGWNAEDPEIRRRLRTLVGSKLPQVCQTLIPHDLILWPRIDTLRLRKPENCAQPERELCQWFTYGFRSDAQQRQETFYEIIRFVSLTGDFEQVEKVIRSEIRVNAVLSEYDDTGYAIPWWEQKVNDQTYRAREFTINTPPTVEEIFSAVRLNPGLINHGKLRAVAGFR
jgi:hypothetical protein